MPKADYLGLTQTRSHFRMLPPSMRQDLLRALTEPFSCEVPLVIHTTLLLARRRPAELSSSGALVGDPERELVAMPWLTAIRFAGSRDGVISGKSACVCWLADTVEHLRVVDGRNSDATSSGDLAGVALRLVRPQPGEEEGRSRCSGAAL